MNIFDYINANEIAAYIQELPSNTEPYLGPFLFPNRNQSGTDISWLKGSEGLPVTIQPSNYDVKASVRERAGFGKVATEMAFFRESMRLGEKDRQQILNLMGNANGLGLAKPLIERLFDDVKTLADGVDAQAEYMRMQLLQYGAFTVASTDGSSQYKYDYSMNPNHKITPSIAWTTRATSDPLKDIKLAQDLIENETGIRPTRMVLNRNTFLNLIGSESLKRSLMVGVTGSPADLRMSDAQLQSYVETQLGIRIQVYSKKVAIFKDSSFMRNPENATPTSLVEDGKVILLPDGAMGSTWFGTTPEQADLMAGPGSSRAKVSRLPNNGTLTTYMEEHPVNVVTIVSAVMIPSFEAIDKVAVLSVGA